MRQGNRKIRSGGSTGLQQAYGLNSDHEKELESDECLIGESKVEISKT